MGAITLPNARACSDITFKVRLKDNDVAVDWNSLSDIRALIYSDVQRAVAGRCTVSIDGEDSTLLVCNYSASKPQYLGINSIVIRATYQGRTKTYDKKAVNIVARTAQLGAQVTINDPTVNVQIEVTEVDTSLLDDAINAAFDAAEDAIAARYLTLATEADVEAAEALRVTAEQGRVDAEALRVSAESGRVDAEALRVSAESGRVNAESGRVDAEAAREIAEGRRVSTMETCVRQEKERADAEDLRVAAEQDRVDAESIRVGNEAGRDENEEIRIGAESERIEAESGRVDAEAARVLAESDRVDAETARAAQASDDHDQYVEDHAVVAGYNTRLTSVEGEVSQLSAETDTLNERTNAFRPDADNNAFTIADSSKNIVLIIDNDGLKSKLYHLCDSDGNVVGTIDSDLISHLRMINIESLKNIQNRPSDKFAIVDENSNAAFVIDGDGVKIRKVVICDSEGSRKGDIEIGDDNLLRAVGANPLSFISQTLGFIPMFQNWGFIGDSLSSGYLAVPDAGGVSPVQSRNIYKACWGQLIAKIIGADATNFSVGGMTAGDWLDTYPNKTTTYGYNNVTKENSVTFNTDKKSIYTICLGTNDYASGVPVGDVSTDVNVSDYTQNNLNTFAGQYGAIIGRCKELVPSCKIFLITPFKWMSAGAENQGYNNVVRQLATMFPKTYLIDFATYGISTAPSYNLGAHCNSMGNPYVAYCLMSEINKIVQNNIDDFKYQIIVDTLKPGYDNGNY